MSETAARRRPRVDREEILDAATEEFMANGYQNTTVASVVRRIGGSNRNIYDYFGDKYGLFTAVMERFRVRVFAAGNDLEPAGRPTVEYLEEFAFAYLSSCIWPDSLAMQRVVIAESVRFPELGRTVLREAESVLQHKLSEFLAERTRAGELDVADPESVAGMFLALVRGEVHLYATYIPDKERTEAEVRAYAGRVVDLFLNGALNHRG